MSNEKTSTNDAPQLTVSDLRKDPDVRSRPLNEIDFDSAMSGKKDVETKDKSSGSDPDASKSKEVKEGETDDESKDASGKENEGQPNRSKGLEKKFKKLTAERTSLKEANDALMARLAALEEKVTGKTDNKSVVTQEQDFKFDKAKPKLGDYKDIVEYNEAVSDWNYDRREAQKEAKLAVTKQSETSNKLFNDFFEKGKVLEKELGLEPGEFAATVQDEDFKFSPEAAVELAKMDGDIGNRIIWQIASDEATKESFMKLTSAKQLTFIGKLEAQLEAKSKDTSSNGGNGFSKQPISKAKAPGKTPKGTSSVSKFDSSRPVNELAATKFESQADYRRARNQNKK